MSLFYSLFNRIIPAQLLASLPFKLVDGTAELIGKGADHMFGVSLRFWREAT